MGDRLRKARVSAEIRVDEMAAHLGVSPDTVTNYEKDKTNPRRAVLLAYANQCNVPLGWIEDPDFGAEVIAAGRDERRGVAASSGALANAKKAAQGRQRTAAYRRQEGLNPHGGRNGLPVKYRPQAELRVLPSAS